MESILTKQQLKTATQIIGTALLKARSSMEMILRTAIDIRKIDYNLDDGLYETKFSNTAEVYVIKTELMGELKGACHLLFSKEEVEIILTSCLPPSLLEDESEEARMMRDGFMTEMDNMVAAAVISSLSDLLEINFYGNIPHMHTVESTLIDSYINRESTDYDTVVHFKAEFHSQDLNISPHFMWMVHEDMLEKIKNKIN